MSSFKWPSWAWWSLFFILGFLLSWNRSETVISDLIRNDISFEPWQPYVWEFSSFISIFFLYFGVYWLADKFPLFTKNWLKHLSIHLLISIVFSLIHVAGMVLIRKSVYLIMGDIYDFGNLSTELLYEYRKDVWSYFAFLSIISAYVYFDKNQILKPQDTNKKIKIKNKQGFHWLKVSEIINIESGGNYIYFHTNEQVLPMRSTMSSIMEMLDPSVFLRIHRSYIVNLNWVKTITDLSSDPCKLVLLTGRNLPVSKKYRSELLALTATHLQCDKLCS